MAKVLVVEDDADIRLLMARVLRIAGHEILTCGGGEEALGQLAGGLRPDVMLLDVQMPDIDGWQVLRRVRENPATSHLPVVLCTVKSQPIDKRAGWTLRADGYITKPFAIGDLVTTVSTVLGTGTPAEPELQGHAWTAPIIVGARPEDEQ